MKKIITLLCLFMCVLCCNAQISYEDKIILSKIKANGRSFHMREDNPDGTYTVTTYMLCYSCKGTNTCSACHGLGGKMMYTGYMPCFHCSGNGRCKTCYHHGYITDIVTWDPKTNVGWKFDLATARKVYITTEPVYHNSGSSSSGSSSSDIDTRTQEQKTLYRPCVSCGGGGNCKYCSNGYRIGTGTRCSTCNGTGICSMCNGAGKKVYKTIK